MFILKNNSKVILITFIVFSIISSIQNSLTSLFMTIIISNIQNNDTTILLKIFPIILATYSFFFLFRFLKDKLKNEIIMNTNLKIKTDYFNFLTVKKFNREGSSKHLSFLTNDLKLFESNYTKSVLLIIDNIFIFVTALIFSLTYDIKMTFIFLVFSIIPGVLPKIFNNTIVKLSEKWTLNNAEYTLKLKESLSGLKTMRVFSTTTFFEERNSNSLTNMEKSLFKMNNFVDFVKNITINIATICMFIPIIIGGYLVISNQLSLAILLGLLQISNSLVNPILAIFEYYSLSNTAQPILNTIQNTKIKSNPDKNESTSVKESTTDFFNITFKNFSPIINGEPLFEKLNIQINNGDKVLIVGPSGAGKSTIFDVLLGFNDCYTGTVTINNIDIKTIDYPQKVNIFSLVQQEPFIINDSIKNNILLGRHAEDRIKNKIYRDSGLTDLIGQKTEDYITGENGENLSGGQKQRIEIARSLSANAPVLLLDEISSSLDKKTADEIYHSLESLSKTLIEISHHVDDNSKQKFSTVINIVPT